MRVTAWMVASLLVVSTVACDRAGTSGKVDAEAMAQEARTGIDSTRSHYVAAWNAANAEAIAALYDDDALVLYPNQSAVAGRSAILSYFKGFFSEFEQKGFDLTSDEIEVAGPWAFDRGTYRWQAVPRAGGDRIEDHGKYLVILRRQADGSWRVARDMDNSDRPLSQMARGAG